MMRNKILFILHLPLPIHGAGMVGQFIKESKLINQTFETDYINLSTSESIDEIGKAGGRKFFVLLKLLKNVLKSLLTKKYNLYYLTLTAAGPGFYKDLLFVFLLKLSGKKIIYHFHNKGIADNKSVLTDYLYRFAFRNTKSILLSPSLYPDIQKYVRSDNVFFCANGIPEEKTDSVLLEEKKEDSPCNLLFLSNLLAEKGVYVLLEACKILKEENIPFVCHFVGPWGDVTETEFYKQAATYKLTENIIVHGRKYGSEKSQALQLADIFVFPTYYHNECFPLVLLEAMQFSLPVVSTYEGGIRDIVKESETGFLVPQKNAGELAAKLKLLIQNPSLRRDMGKKGFERYAKYFTLEMFEKEITATLEKAINLNQ